MNNNEPIILGKVKKGKTGKPILGLIIFLFIGSFLLFLPTIINYFGDYSPIDLIKKGEIVDFIKNHESYVNKNIKEEEKKETETSRSLLNTKSVIKFNNITLSNFILKKDALDFDVSSSKEINLDTEQLFLSITQNDKEITTIKLEGIIKDKQTKKVIFKTKLSSTLNIYGEVKIIRQNEYPDFTLTSDESGIAGLICTKENDEIEYVFNLNKLTNINETLNFIDDGNNDNYLTEFTKYSNLKDKIIKTNNNSELIEDNVGFTFKSNIDLTIFNETITNYYKLNTQPKIIKYEMTSKGYDCK